MFPFLASLLVLPTFDPIALQLGPVAIRWYSLAYIGGFALGWWLVSRRLNRTPQPMTRQQLDDLLTWVVLGVVLGGRFGYVLFYHPAYYASHPLEALMLWEGGMSFHGGMLGAIFATLGFCRHQKLRFYPIMDRVALVTPIGLGLGRIANFVNQELYGRPTDVPWAMLFPTDPAQLPRHPSQLYEAALEGLVLFLLLYGLDRKGLYRREGLLSGLFLSGYALARITGECFREPDAHIGFLAFGITYGQILSLPMFAFGLWLVMRSRHHQNLP